MRHTLMAVGLALGACAGSKPAPSASPPEYEIPTASASSPAAPTAPPVDRPVAEQPPDAGTRRCEGAITAELMAAIRQRAQSARDCYESALQKDPKLRGRLQVAFRVGEHGEVLSASLPQDTVGSEELRTCVLGLAQMPYRYFPEHGCIDVALPIQFQPKDADAGP